VPAIDTIRLIASPAMMTPATLPIPEKTIFLVGGSYRAIEMAAPRVARSPPWM
jgi:hypothetical protein